MNSDIKFYMKIPLKDGTYTNGIIDYNKHPALFGLTKIRLEDKRVLDIAANDGFWSFWAESSGCKDVTAIDIDSFENYDWGYEGCVINKEFRSGYSHWDDNGAGFWYLHNLFNSKVKRENLSVYNLFPETYGSFDIIFMYGLLYHLRHPLLALDRIRRVCSGAVLIETHVVNRLGDLPVSIFYLDNVFREVTNWTGPSENAVVSWMKSAGFPHIFSNKPDSTKAQCRQIFIGCIDEYWRDSFQYNSELKYFDQDYFEKLRDNIEVLLEESIKNR